MGGTLGMNHTNPERTFLGKGNPLMEAMFGACVRWAWEDEEMRQAFEAETGMKLAESSIEATIDDATGYREVVAEEFVRWVVENVWGKAEGEG